MTAQEIQHWITQYLSRTLEVPPGAVDVHASFERLGIDSVTAVGLVGDLETHLGLEIDPTLPYDFPSIAALSSELARLKAGVQAAPVDA